MTEELKNIAALWNGYWGEGGLMFLFLAAALYLLIFCRKKRTARFLLCYSVIIFILYWCPLFAIPITRIIGNTYWRMLWMLPVFPVIAYAFTELLGSLKQKWAFLICAVLLIGVVAVSGKDFWSQEYFFSYGNRQKVPDAVAYICETIREDAGDQEVKVAVDNRYAPYIRVYDASIRMPFGRNGRGAAGKKSRKLYRKINKEVPNGKTVGRIAKKLKCNYLVVRIYDEAGLSKFEKAGYYQIAEHDIYKILRYEGTFDKSK